jgi:chromosome segregation ATPase
VARDTETGAAEPAGATVVDRAVLAERRARRAELAEQAIARRAEEAERALAELEGELAKLELRLERATDERAELMASLSEVTRDARAASQRAEAERRRREESVAEASEHTSEAEDEAARVRERAEAAGEHARELGARGRSAAPADRRGRARRGGGRGGAGPRRELARTAEAAAAERIAAERTATVMQRAETLADEGELAARAREAEPPPVQSPAAPDSEAMHALLDAERGSRGRVASPATPARCVRRPAMQRPPWPTLPGRSSRRATPSAA